MFIILIYLGGSALENHHYMTVRFFIIMGAAGILILDKWIIDVMGTPSKSDS